MIVNEPIELDEGYGTVTLNHIRTTKPLNQQDLEQLKQVIAQKIIEIKKQQVQAELPSKAIDQSESD